MTHRSPAARRSALPALALAFAFVGCIVVAPIEELPEPVAFNGSGGKGGSNGASGTGNTGDGGSGLDGGGGKAANGGTGGASAGTAGKGGGSGAGGGHAGSGTSGSKSLAGEGGAGGESECTTNAECVRQGANEPYLCRQSDRRCAQILSNECPLVYGNYNDPNAIFFGAFATLNLALPQRNSVAWAAELAVKDINDAGGIPDGPDGKGRSLVMITCNNDERAGVEALDEAARHLVDDLEVKSMLATLKPGDLLRVAEKYKQRKLFYLSPVALTSDLTDPSYKDGGRIWNLLGEPLDFADAYAELLRLVEAHMRVERGWPDAAANPIKVALVTTDDIFNYELSSFVFTRLSWNGQGAGVNNQAGYYLDKTVTVADPKLSDVAQEILDFGPDIIISTAAEEVTQPEGILQLVEQGWDGPGGRGERPYWILSPYNAGDLGVVEAWILAASTPPALADETTPRRFIGLSAASADDPTLKNQFVSRLRAAHLGDNPIEDTGNYYDAVYFLSYALYASGNPGTPSGSETAAGMTRLITGDRKDDVPDQIDAIFEKLADAETKISLYTTLGAPDFNPQTGVLRATPTVFCYELAGVEEMSPFVRLNRDVLRYDRADGKFTGTYPCLDDFLPPDSP